MNIKIIAAIGAIICIIVIGCFMIFDSGYFDVKKIFSNYCKIFNNKLKIIIIYVFLLILSISIGIIEIISSALIDSITLIVSILSAAFLAFLPVIMELRNKKIESIKEEEYKKVCETTNNVLIFELLISVVELFFCFVYMFLHTKMNLTNNIYIVMLSAFSSAIYYLVFIILLNILLILKRIRILINFQWKHTV